MDRPATTARATARDVIQEIVRNMKEGLEPLHYSTLAPAVYNVYLHPEDAERLRAILPRILDEARRALDAELESLNKASMAERIKIRRRGDPRVVAPENGWQIRILENTDDGVEPGEIEIHSELAMPPKLEFGAGSMTKRIATRRNVSGGRTTYQKQDSAATPAIPTVEATPGDPSVEQERDQGVPRGPGGPPHYAVIEYDDNGGHKTYLMTKEQIVVGRGGRDYWTDLRLDTAPDVSREHFRLRRDPETGKFFLKDLSRLGTTINGEKAPSSIEFVDGEKRDRNLEVTVPEQARIGLADVVFLEFRSAAHG
jgi:hypothetical protein